MKILALFLTLFVLFLTVVPCCVFEDSRTNVVSTTVEKAADCADHNNDQCNDCSPFYVCGTCLGFTFAQGMLMHFGLSLNVITHDTNYLVDKAYHDPSVIWQPPK